ncbi:unnamed protein product [Paramecium primaurelia]|uniref:Uncharacterized protein n=1 Tax=Paramecium primaurelia TaxID=5886 RepID=A0A8S1NEH7_PARPR|nr:unnamed protein product [Paramecium primaurelia]
MQQKLETIKGWDIDTSFESQGILKPKINQIIAEEPCQTKTLSSERKPSPKKINKTPKTRTPINSVHYEQGSLSSNSLGKLYVKKQFKQPLPPPQLLTVSKLKLRLNALPQQPSMPQKAYSSAQLNTILQLKRKNMYLQSILKKVNNNESEERYNKSQCDQLMVTHNRASQSMWMESTMAMRSFFNTRIGHFKANGTKHKFVV